MRSAELTPIRYEALSAPADQRQKINVGLLFLHPSAPRATLTFGAVGLCLLLPLLLLELHVAEVHDGPDYFVAAVLLIGLEAEDIHGVLRGSGQTSSRSFADRINTFR